MEKLRKLTKFNIIISMHRQPIEQLKINCYDKCFVYFKSALIGGVTTAEELGFMGRKTIGRLQDGDYIMYNSIEQACEIIEDQAKNIGKVIGSVLDENYFDAGEEWKQVKFWN